MANGRDRGADSSLTGGPIHQNLIVRTPTMLACITRSVGDISHNARFTHIADWTELDGSATSAPVSARWLQAAVAQHSQRWSASRCRTHRKSPDKARP